MSDRFLSTPLRRAVERTIKEARAVAEEAAADAIRRLGVADAKSPPYLDEGGQELRRRLRAHGRALGDQKAADDMQTTDRLIEATAYEHWHRRLFARFLAERHLLRHPEHGVLVTLEDCKEFAADEGLADEWAAAEAYASKMLPAVFRPEDPVLALEFSPEHELKLRQLVLGIEAETFQADDALGWTYQFWRALEKDRVNKAGGKIGAAELPAVTQLFTEPYMVRFLLHNTLGAWWAGKVLAARPELASEAPDEATLRAAVRLPGYDFDMLRFVKEGDHAPRWRPAAGTCPGWPAEVKDLTVLDPCCGSGHFLTEALTILAALRGQEEGVSAAASVSAVLRDNLFGLELDGRCVQIAAFAVALTAWKVGGFQPLPAVHIAWVGAPPPLGKAEFLALANGDAVLRNGLDALFRLFEQAPLLGSLIEPLGGDLADPQRVMDSILGPLLKKARQTDPELAEGVIAARGMADAAAMLARKYTLIVTNVPFLGQRKQNSVLALKLASDFPAAKADLAAAMLQRATRLLDEGGTVAAVTPQSWLHQSSYQRLRLMLLERMHFGFVCQLGSGAFETISGEVVNTALITLTNERADANAKIVFCDCNQKSGRDNKQKALQNDDLQAAVQVAVLDDDDVRVSVSSASNAQHLPLSHFAITFQGIKTGDDPRHLQKFWERLSLRPGWLPMQTTVQESVLYGGACMSVRWVREGADLIRRRREGQTAAAKYPSVAITQMGDLPATLMTSLAFDSNVSPLFVLDSNNLAAIFCYCASPEYASAVKAIEPSMKANNSTLLKVPFDEKKWRQVAEEMYPEGLPAPYSDDPTQWLFHGHPAQAGVGTQLHVALARLAGYGWPAERDPEMRLSSEAREWVTKAQALPSPDADGLLTLPAAGGDRPLGDRLRDYLAACFGEVWGEALEQRLVAEADELFDNKSAKNGSLDGWLRDRAFRQHCKLFHDRPFLWQIWDGQKDGFSAFLHYHRLNHAVLQKLTYTVLGDWIARRKAEGDDRRVEAAAILQSRLAAILEGEAPHDIFVRWKTLEQQPLGWLPDLNDGVRLNIRPWVEAGVLREIPRIKWGVDRGTDPNSAPWYPLDQGKRNNDRHTTLAEKRAARASASATAA